MRFDDRLLTVLNQPAGDRHDAAVRWRQLVDLVARAGPNSASPVVAEALGIDPQRIPQGRGELARRGRSRGRRFAVAAGPARMLRGRPAGGFGPGARRGQPRCRAVAQPARRRRRRDAPVRRDPSSRARRPRTPTRPPRRWSSAPSPNRMSSIGPRGPRRPRRPPAPARRSAMLSRGSNAAAAAASNWPGRAPLLPRLERRRCSAGNAGHRATSPGSTVRRAAP